LILLFGKDKNMPKVSVIIPVYKVEQYLEECLKSVINQTFTDIEIICVNDCSPDNCGEILKEYSEKDKRIKVINNEKNSGLSYSRNRGIDISSGQYICFLDSDDTIEYNIINKLYCIAENNNLDLLKYNYITKTENNRKYFKYPDTNIVERGMRLFCDLMNSEHAGFWLSCTNFVKKTFLQNNNISFYENIYYEDVLFSYYCLKYAQKAMCINDYGYVYYRRFNSITTSKRTNKNLSSFIISIKRLLKDLYSFDDENYNYALCSYINIFIRKAIAVIVDLAKSNVTINSDDLKFILNYIYYYMNINSFLSNVNIIKSYNNIIVYGAGKVAKEVIDCLNIMNIKIDGVTITKVDSNKVFMGHKIYDINTYNKNSLVVIAVSKKYHNEIIENLKLNGFNNWVKIGEKI